MDCANLCHIVGYGGAADAETSTDSAEATRREQGYEKEQDMDRTIGA